MMPIVFIPPELRSLCNQQRSVQVNGNTVGEVFAALDEMFPGVKDRLCSNGELKPALAITVNYDVSSRGLAQEVQSDSEIHILPAIGGG